MPTATVTGEGRITIPREVRQALGLQPGDRVAFRVSDGAAIMEPQTVDLKELFSSLASPVAGVTVEEMRAAATTRRIGG